MTKARGGCLCGAIRYAVDKEPARVTMCHCKFCQRATGGAYMVEPIFGAEDFAVTSGTPRTYSLISEGSGKEVTIHFCENCGTKLWLSFERFAGAIGIYGGTFDDPNWFEITSANAKHIFLSAARHGTVIPPFIDTFEGHGTNVDGAPNTPTVFHTPKTIGAR